MKPQKKTALVVEDAGGSPKCLMQNEGTNYSRKKHQAQRIHDYYREISDTLITPAQSSDYDNPSFLKRIAEVQRRKAFAGRVLSIGLYSKTHRP